MKKNLILFCLFGFIITTGATAEPLPENAQPNPYGAGWEFNRGYYRLGEGCLKVTVPDNGSLDITGHRWTCNSGYKKIKERCLKIVVANNARVNHIGNDWTCLEGFIRRDDGCVHVQNATDDEIREVIIATSIATYHGNCPCPYFSDRAGRRCGRRSAYSRAGGYSPICYKSDITNEAVKSFIERYMK